MNQRSPRNASLANLLLLKPQIDQLAFELKGAMPVWKQKINETESLKQALCWIPTFSERFFTLNESGVFKGRAGRQMNSIRKTRRVHSASSIILALLGITGAALVYASEGAQVSVYLFQDGKPLEQVEFRVDNQPQGITDINGHARTSVSSGRHVLTFQLGAKELAELDLPFVAGEDVQILITTYDDGRKPLVEIESSNEGDAFVEASEIKPADTGMGVIEGVVLSAENQKPIANAQIYISGMRGEYKTDQDGRFRVEVPVGAYSVSVMHHSFSAQIKDGLEVAKDQTVSHTFAMTPAGFELPEHVVLEPYIAGSLAAIVEEQKTSAQVASVLGAEQITRAGDSDAASALRRATGLTLVGGKFVYVRGLGERYSSTLLNGAPIPSPDPTRRVVPLDLFPTSVLDTIMIQKSYSVDRPGEFAGGTVEMRTRAVPDSFFFNLNYQFGVNEGTSFEPGLRYKGGSTDAFGIDDGTRALPASLSAATAGGRVLRPQSPANPSGATPQQLKQYGQDLSNVWTPRPTELGPDNRVNLGVGDMFHFDDFGFGYTLALRWSDSWDTQEEKRRIFAPISGNRLELTVDDAILRTEREAQLTGYLGLEFNYTDNHRIHANSMILRQTLDEARVADGWTDSEQFNIRRTRLTYEENSLLVGQISGDHHFDFLNKLDIHWLYTRATAGRDAPKERIFRYDQDPVNGGIYTFTRRADSNQTNYAALGDEDESYRIDVKMPFELYDKVELAMQGGMLQQMRTRNSSIRRFSFASVGPDSRRVDVLALPMEEMLSPQYIGPNGFVLRESTRATDNYDASQEILAYYGQGDLNLFETVRLTGGMRVEDNKQKVKTFELFNPNNQPVITELVKTDLLPSAAATWFITDKQQLRASYSESISRPDFRELSPAPFMDPMSDSETLGNPDLKQAAVTSYDTRWEYYFSSNENLTIGGFYKDITNPIELVLLPGPGGLLSLQNAKIASVYGAEAEIMKHLEFIDEDLENFYIAANYTWTRSQIELLPENLTAQTTNFRPLQGHSPYVINVQLGYDNPDAGILGTIVYNSFGERIAEVGSLGAPDIYEKPRHQIDLVYRHRIMDELTLTFNLRNLLDDEILFTQGDQIARSYRRGREFRMGFVLDF